MPIYAYQCGSCGHAKDVLQKIADAPACGADTFAKQLTAPGFQLKGTGWYATDFSGRKPPTAEAAPEKVAAAASPAPAQAASDA